jgi:hypothetical protein
MPKDELKKELERLFGSYVPNKVDMDNLTSYLYKMFVSIFKDADMKKEYKGIKGITQLDEDGFKKAIKDIALFTSQKVLVETMNRSYRELKNVVPLVDVSSVKTSNNKKSIISAQKNNFVAEAEFDIDIKNIPKVKKQKVKVEEKDSIPSEFESVINVELLDEINKNTQKMGVVSNSDDDEGNLTLGTGFLSEGYSSVPDVDISLDY